jgi:hypothetical protein
MTRTWSVLKWVGIWLLAQLIGGIVASLTGFHAAALSAATLLGVILVASIHKAQRSPLTVLLFSLGVVISVGLVGFAWIAPQLGIR